MAKVTFDNIFQIIADKINGTPKPNSDSNVKENNSEETPAPQIESKEHITISSEPTDNLTKNVEAIDEPHKPVNVTEKEQIAHLKQQQPTDAIKKRGELIKSIVDTIAENFKGFNATSFNGKALVIWINNNIFYNSIDGNTGFQGQVLRTIYDELGFEFNRISFRPGPLPEEEMVTPLIHDAFMQIVSVAQVGILKKAKLTAIEGYGSTMESYYVLDSTGLKKLPQERYNIGIGRNPLIGPNTRRENQIAIDDSHESPEFEKNKYVSRSHAHIVFSENHGFMLRAEVGGTPAGGKRTYIQRGNETIKLENTITAVPLKNGDTIILTKKVYLEFKEL